MTLLVALKGKDGLVLAADSRGTFGDPRGATAQNDTQQKAHILSPHVAALVAGVGPVGALIVDMVKKNIAAAKTDGATAVLNALRDTARERYNNWFPSIPPMQPPAAMALGQVATRPALSFLVAGYEGDGTPRLYGLESYSDFSPMLHDYGFAVQGIAQYALYLLNRLYESDRTVEELTPLAVYVITETASQDGKVGGPVNVITIEAGEKGCQCVAPDAVQKVQEANTSRSKELRDSFYRKEVAS